MVGAKGDESGLRQSKAVEGFFEQNLEAAGWERARVSHLRPEEEMLHSASCLAEIPFGDLQKILGHTTKETWATFRISR